MVSSNESCRFLLIGWSKKKWNTYVPSLEAFMHHWVWIQLARCSQSDFHININGALFSLPFILNFSSRTTLSWLRLLLLPLLLPCFMKQHIAWALIGTNIYPKKFYDYHALVWKETNVPVDLHMGAVLPFIASCFGPRTKGLFLTQPSVLNLFWING